jgi:hypothetical protein
MHSKCILANQANHHRTKTEDLTDKAPVDVILDDKTNPDTTKHITCSEEYLDYTDTYYQKGIGHIVVPHILLR